MKSVELEKLQLFLHLKVDKEIPDRQLSSMISYKVTGYVWSQDAGRKVEFKYPSDWWEAFKERWLKWMKVKYTVKTFQVKATYPDLNIDHHEPVMRLMQTTGTLNLSPIQREHWEQRVQEYRTIDELKERVILLETAARTARNISSINFWNFNRSEFDNSILDKIADVLERALDGREPAPEDRVYPVLHDPNH